jgi:MoaA/NifB/PqqE/SkfB family radical SAM enzyme
MSVPGTLVLELSYRCNLRCRICWWWGDAGVLRAGNDASLELPLVTWLQWLSSVSKHRPHLRITGGEPLCHPGLLTFIDAAAAQGMGSSLITNGTLLDRTAIERLLASGLAQINISLDGDPAGDAAVRGETAFARTLAAIETLCETKRRRRLRIPDILVNCVITPQNLDGLQPLAASCRRLGVSLRLQHLMWLEPEAYEAHRRSLRERLGLDDDTMRGLLLPVGTLDVERLIAVLRQLDCLRDSSDRAVYTLPRLSSSGIREWYAAGRQPSPGGCDYVRRAARIRPNGEAVGCPFINYPLGNIQSADLVGLLASPRARAFRSELAARPFPGCARCCKRPA